MSFEESALARLRRYHGEADRSLGLAREAEKVARRFSERLFGGPEYTAALGREAGFEVETAHENETFELRISAGPGARAAATFGLLEGAAEKDEDLMHEALSRYALDASGYSGRILGFSEQVGENPCQVFAVYRDGVWKTKGTFVERARKGGRLRRDPERSLPQGTRQARGPCCAHRGLGSAVGRGSVYPRGPQEREEVSYRDPLVPVALPQPRASRGSVASGWPSSARGRCERSPRRRGCVSYGSGRAGRPGRLSGAWSRGSG